MRHTGQITLTYGQVDTVVREELETALFDDRNLSQEEAKAFFQVLEYYSTPEQIAETRRLLEEV